MNNYNIGDILKIKLSSSNLSFWNSCCFDDSIWIIVDRYKSNFYNDNFVYNIVTNQTNMVERGLYNQRHVSIEELNDYFELI